MEGLLERDHELTAVDALLVNGGAVLLVEGGMGIGKTSLLQAACARAGALGREVLRARGSELEEDFGFGIVRQLFERRLTRATPSERGALLAGPAGAVRALLLGESGEAGTDDTSFAVLHGLYWLTANLADQQPLLITVDDAHWADGPSLRWLAHLAPRLSELTVALIVAMRPVEAGASMEVLRAEASESLRPGPLSEAAVDALVRRALGRDATEQLCAAVCEASGGNPLYVAELLRAVNREDLRSGGSDAAALMASGAVGLEQRVLADVRKLGPRALTFAQALAVLGDGCEVRHAGAMVGLRLHEALELFAGLVRIGVLAADDAAQFVHPMVRAAVYGSLAADRRDAAHRSAARLLHADGAPPGLVAAHLVGVQPGGDDWVQSRLRDAAQVAMRDGAPSAAAALLDRALAEPPPPAQRVEVLLEAARAQASAGNEVACTLLEKALGLVTDPRRRAAIALEVAQTYAALFRWVEAVEVIERALAELGDADEELAARLDGELVVCGVHDARCASRVVARLERLSSRSLTGSAPEALDVARGMRCVLAGRPASEAADLLESALSRARVENWDTRAALLWSLVAAERFEVVEAALDPLMAEVNRSGSARGLVATYSTLGVLKLRLGALPEAYAAARVALRVLQEGDFAPGLAFAATVLADVAVEAGELEEAQALIDLLPQEGWPAGVGSVLIPAARGRLRLAQGRAADALRDFRLCAAMFSPDVWSIEMRDVGYLHARTGAAQALLRLGDRERARELAQAELDDVRVFGAARALGIALRVAGLAQGGTNGLEPLRESVAILTRSPALLERARSLTELGAALRRAGERAAAREPLAQALDLAARCGARPLIARARHELTATGARPRREWRTGVEALTPCELRIVRLAHKGESNRQIAHELYVSLKTVEGHLSRAYAKLGIDGRSGLAQALGEEKTRVPTL